MTALAIYLLDTGPLGLLAHDRPAHRVLIQAWLVQEMTAGASIYMSEVADYEVCRELTQLIRAGLNFLTAFQKKTMVVMCNKRTDFIP